MKTENSLQWARWKKLEAIFHGFAFGAAVWIIGSTVVLSKLQASVSMMVFDVVILICMFVVVGSVILAYEGHKSRNGSLSTVSAYICALTYGLMIPLVFINSVAQTTITIKRLEAASEYGTSFGAEVPRRLERAYDGIEGCLTPA